MTKFHQTMLVACFIIMAGTIGSLAGQLKAVSSPSQEAVTWHTETPPADVPLQGLWYWSDDPADPPLAALFIYTRFGTFFEFPGYGMETMERAAPDFWTYLPGEKEARP